MLVEDTELINGSILLAIRKSCVLCATHVALEEAGDDFSKDLAISLLVHHESLNPPKVQLAISDPKFEARMAT